MTKLREMLRQSPLPNLSSPSKNNLHNHHMPLEKTRLFKQFNLDHAPNA
jgi:hypothetical protein